MKKSVVSSLVKEINYVFAEFNLIKIIPLVGREREVPFYGDIRDEYLGKFITLTTTKGMGILGRRVKQKIEGNFKPLSINLSRHYVNTISKIYKIQLFWGNKYEQTRCSS